MKKIRINNDITVRWTITTNGAAESLEGRNLALLITNTYQRTTVTDFTVAGNVVRFVFAGAQQRYCGVYTLVLQDTTDGMRTVDTVQAFELVQHSIDQNGADDSNITTETVELTSDMQFGYDGKSAYEVAVRNGFAGSETEWLASLKGDKGDAFRYEDFTPEQVSALMAPATDAATNADAAADACNTATTKANDATAAANTAATNAVAATEAAVTAKQNADAATASATTATGLANTAAAEATTAKQNADAATDAANTAASLANQKATLAQTATDAANTAANAANTAANAANTAANAATTAANAANTAATNADAATALANQAALNWEKNW